MLKWLVEFTFLIKKIIEKKVNKNIFKQIHNETRINKANF